MRDSGHWGWLVDHRWNYAYVTDEIRLTFGGGEMSEWPGVGEFVFGTHALEVLTRAKFGSNSLEGNRVIFRNLGGWTLADSPGGREELRARVDPGYLDLVDELEPMDVPVFSYLSEGMGVVRRRSVAVPIIAFRIRDDAGRLVGTALISKPAAAMSMIGAMTSSGDLDHFARMMSVSSAARRPAAVMFADLDASSSLSKSLSTASYFRLARRLVTEFDDCVIDAGGLLGRHVGDGVAAFFVAESFASESAAARACIEAVTAVRAAAVRAAERSEVPADQVNLRFGLHWGTTLYVGAITTAARSEVTALGDEVNEGARIEACASGGRALASKELIERLSPSDAVAVGIDPDRAVYTQLSDLATATDKARRDAPAISVCEI